MSIVVRTASATDLSGLLDLYLELNPDDSRLSAETAASVWAAMTEHHGRQVLVAEKAGTIVGTVDCTVWPNLTRGGRPVLLVDNVVVTRRLRRGGIGRALMTAVSGLAAEQGCYKIQLIAADDPEAHAFYRSCGYGGNDVGFRRYLRVPDG